MSDSIGTSSVSVVPDAEGFFVKLAALLEAEAAELGQKLGDTIGDALRREIEESLNRPFHVPDGPLKAEGAKAGNAYGDAFSRSLKARLEAAARNLPDFRPDMDLTRADAKLAMLRARMENLASRGIGDMDANVLVNNAVNARSELDAIATDRNASVDIRLNASEASAELSAFIAKVEALDAMHASPTVDVDTTGARRNIGLLATAIITLGPTLVPLGAAAAATVGALGAMGAAGVLAILGIKDAMESGSAVGQQYSASVKTVKDDFELLKSTAATGMLEPFQDSISQLHGQMPAFNSQIGDLSESLGRIGGNLASGVIGGFETMRPLISDITAGAERFSAKFETFATGGGLQRFTDYAREALPQVTAFLGELGEAAVHLVQGLSGVGLGALGGLRVILEIFNAIPVDVLKAAAPAVIGFVAALKTAQIADSVASGLQRASTAMANVATNAGNMSKIGTAAGTVSTGLGKASGALSKFASALPGLGALAGPIFSLIDDAIHETERNIESARQTTSAMLNDLQLGGYKAESAARALAAYNAKIDELRTMGTFGEKAANDMAAGLEKAQKEADAAAKAMSPLEKAQQAATKATNDYNAAVDKYGPTSSQAAAAQAKLSSATEDVAKAQKDAAAATQSATDALREQQNLILAATGSEVALSRAKEAVTAAQDNYNKVVLQGTGTTAEQTAATNDLTQAVIDASNAAYANAEAEAKKNGATNASAQGTTAAKAVVDQYVASVGGAAPAAILKMQAELNAASNSAYGNAAATAAATSQVSGYIVMVNGVPTYKSTTIAADTSGAYNQVNALVRYINTQHGTITVTTVNNTVYTTGTDGRTRSSGGGLSAKSVGGRVWGPGSGVSDDVPSVLSAGEFVATHMAVNRPGNLAALEAANRGARIVAVGPDESPVQSAPAPVSMATSVRSYARDGASRVASPAPVIMVQTATVPSSAELIEESAEWSRLAARR